MDNHNLINNALCKYLFALSRYQQLLIFVFIIMATVNDSSSNLVTMLKFPQEGKTPRESYLPFFESVCDVAASKTASNQEFGLLGAVLTVAQYDIISPGVPFIILVNPGPLNPLAPPAERRLHAAQTKEFETHAAAWTPRDQAIASYSHPCALFGTNVPASYSHGQSHNPMDNARLSIRRLRTPNPSGNGGDHTRIGPPLFP